LVRFEIAIILCYYLKLFARVDRFREARRNHSKDFLNRSDAPVMITTAKIASASV
jgi:hypothetical protein